MVERIRELLQQNELTPTQFADTIGVARPIISHILSGRNKPSLEVVQKILAAFPQLSLDWLLKGTGTMLAGSPVSSTEAASGAATVQQSTSRTVTPTPGPVEASPDPTPARKATRPPRYKPQPVLPLAMESGASVGRAATSPSAYAPYEPMPAATAPTTGSPAAVPANEPTVPTFAPVTGVVEPVIPVVPPVLSVSPAELTTAAQAVAAPSKSADVSLASAFAEPGKVIRRIVIFYQDGTFTDYQPELRS